MGIPQVRARGILRWYGKFRFMYGHAIFYVGIVNMLMLAMTTYNTTVREWANEYLGWSITFWVFIGILAVVVTFGLILEYIISIPAVIAESNEQMYKHDSPIQKDFDDVKRKLNLLMEHLEIEDTDLDRENKKKT